MIVEVIKEIWIEHFDPCGVKEGTPSDEYDIYILELTTLMLMSHDIYEMKEEFHRYMQSMYKEQFCTSYDSNEEMFYDANKMVTFETDYEIEKMRLKIRNYIRQLRY